jgi:DNA invertase Pin-like site-specific DNA recombinase
MLRIGYVRPGSEDRVTELAAQTQTLNARGCDVIRCEQPSGDGYAVLYSVLDFIDEGDQLVVGRLEHLGSSARAMLEAIQRLEGRGASLQVVDPDISSHGPTGFALRAALEAVAAVEPLARARQPAAAADIRAMRSAGFGPVEIARRLGVSRMTVWRKLKSAETCQA